MNSQTCAIPVRAAVARPTGILVYGPRNCWPVLRGTLVLAAHLALIAWLLAQVHQSGDISQPVARMEVRTVVEVSSSPPGSAIEAPSKNQPALQAPEPAIAQIPADPVSVPLEQPTSRSKVVPVEKKDAVSPRARPASNTSSQTAQAPIASEVTGGAGSGGSNSAGSGDFPVSAARFDAEYLNNPAPPYPIQSRRLREEGAVHLLVLVSESGDARNVQIFKSSGFSRLDEAALNAVRQWRFVPAKRGNVAIAAQVIVPINFKQR